ALLPVGAHPAPAQQATELRIATVAPEGSPWMRVFRAWDRELRQRTEGRLGLRLYPGGSQGQEPDYIDKMHAGQLDGAALTSTGLSEIVRPVLVLGLPGVVDDYATLDRVRRRMGRRFEAEFDRRGYALLGWGDVGRGRLFSRRRIARPADLRRARPWAPRSDVVFSSFLEVVGARPRRLGIPEVYPALQTGMVDTVPGSALGVIALQWHTRLRYYAAEGAGILIGATILRKEKLDALPEADRRVLLETSRRGHRLVARAVRREDDRAFEVIQQRMTAVDTRAHEEEWVEAALETKDRLMGRVFPRPLFDAVVRAAAE
ncbi:MAG TPA: TRAP transporter substrate-binding protein DctP, partial [Polyangiaceae bacterium LLY-WYZ-15_(1-7)]|nr:TRAP transporter substrate-binding protein DctP [Polyangiaceae bacterium LLY-WYZ-15_(1-7)]